MKKGFALLETLIVISFLAVSLLLLYNTFIDVRRNAKKNYLYDDVANIYKTYYIKEYLEKNGLSDYFNNKDIQKVVINNDGFNEFITNLNVTNIYLVKYDLKEYNENLYSLEFNDYFDNLAIDEDYDYRLIIEYKIDNNSFFANIGLGDNDE